MPFVQQQRKQVVRVVSPSSSRGRGGSIASKLLTIGFCAAATILAYTTGGFVERRIGLPSYYLRTFSSSSTETVPSTATRSNRDGSSSAGGAKFVFAMGVEGTGHHILQDVLKKSPSVQHLQTWNVYEHAVKAQDELISIWTGSCINDISHLDPNDSVQNHFEQLVQLLQQMDDTIRHEQEKEEFQHSTTKTKTSTVMLNMLDKMVSYPTGYFCDRNGQYFDLTTLYKACEVAKVQCGHIIMSRDAFQVIHSTVNKRNFAQHQDQIHLMINMLRVISDQMLAYPNHLEACYNFNDASDGADDWGRLFGWEGVSGGDGDVTTFSDAQKYTINGNSGSTVAADATLADAAVPLSFNQLLSEIYQPPATSESSLDNANIGIPPESQAQMQTMVLEMERIRTMCKKQRRLQK